MNKKEEMTTIYLRKPLYDVILEYSELLEYSRYCKPSIVLLRVFFTGLDAIKEEYERAQKIKL